MYHKMHERLNKVLHGKRDVSPAEKHAKMGVLHDLKNEMSGEMGSKLDGLKKVSVMSNSPEGLEHGLDKAHEMVSQPDDQMSEGGMAGYAEGGDISPEEESENPEMEANEDSDQLEHEHQEDMDLQTIKAKIDHLLQLQAELESKSK